MTRDDLNFGINIASAFCWAICFWWMYRISARQDAFLAELHEQTDRIEELSQEEHELIRDVHPQVGEIKEAVGKVAADVHRSARG